MVGRGTKRRVKYLDEVIERGFTTKGKGNET